MMLPTKIFNAIEQVRRGGKIDMHNVELVIFYLRSCKEEEAATWIEKFPLPYKIGILEGFEIDNRQESQVGEMHESKPG